MTVKPWRKLKIVHQRPTVKHVKERGDKMLNSRQAKISTPKKKKEKQPVSSSRFTGIFNRSIRDIIHNFDKTDFQ